MSKIQEFHPSEEQIAAYSEGTLKDVAAFEAHLDTCEDCSQAVLVGRQIRLLVTQQYLPQMSSDERRRKKERLRSSLRILQPTKQQGPTAQNMQPNKSEGLGDALLGGLAALAGAWGFGHSPPDAIPSLAGNDSDETENGPTSDSKDSDPSEKSDLDVTDGRTGESIGGQTDSLEADAEEFFAQLKEVLDAPSENLPAPTDPLSEFQSGEDNTVPSPDEGGDPLDLLDETWGTTHPPLEDSPLEDEHGGDDIDDSDLPQE